MGHWRKTYDFKTVVKGVTVRIRLDQSIYGWELKGWVYTIGNAKANPEGDPIVRRTFGDEDEAYKAWQEACVRAITEQVEYIEAAHPTLQTVDPEKQAAIDNASREDRQEVNS